jgi:hypothetical protein
MAILVTVAQADAHLRLDLANDGASPLAYTDERLPDLQLKIDQAEAIVTNYLKLGDAAFELALNGDPNTSPPTAATWSGRDRYNVQAAILCVLSALYDDAPDRTLADYMRAGGVVSLVLARLRDPAIA